MIRANAIGILDADLQEVVILSLDAVENIASRLGVTVDELLQPYGGITIPLNGEVTFPVSKTHVVTAAGDVKDVVLIGGNPVEIVRFLNSDEECLDSWMRKHPDYCILGEGQYFNQDVYDDLVRQYNESRKSIVP